MKKIKINTRKIVSQFVNTLNVVISNLSFSSPQKQVLESRLGDLQKQYDSLSEAHNSLEQLNSNWSEKNMVQRTKIEAMTNEEDELKRRLTQAEESYQSQREINEQLKSSFENEVLNL